MQTDKKYDRQHYQTYGLKVFRPSVREETDYTPIGRNHSIEPTFPTLGTHPTVHQTVKQQIPINRHNLNKETTINFELIGKNSITN
jgi:hypothetical protein